MTDIYDHAIQATLEHDRIISSWIAGGNEDGIPLHGLLFRSCPHLGCCLTECKNGMYDYIDEDLTKAHQLIENLKNDDLIPSTQDELETVWLDEPATKTRTALLKRFAMYNRGLDEVFDREPVDIDIE